ncbi:MAG: gluconate transporter, partial [Phaeodactylibacter sp.]|nr:gluconate transporter [Phaeodactylibacter sp.]
VATVVGLGAIFGGLLEHAGGAQVITQRLLKGLGERHAPTALLISGFLIAIPVFFDVAFIILVPVVYAIQRKTGRSLLLYAIPLLAGLAITHSFIPPTPGPIAVADILGVDLGSVIIAGLIAGIPTAIVSGLWFGKYISGRIHIDAPEVAPTTTPIDRPAPSFGLILFIIQVPIALILIKTFFDAGFIKVDSDGFLGQAIGLLGHPFSALLIANFLAWWLLGIGQGFSSKTLHQISVRSLIPTGTIILLTGAGGAFKQILIDTSVGEQLAEVFQSWGLSVILFAYLAAVAVRLLQGSATVAMITAAGLAAPLIELQSHSGLELGALVIVIASGASIFSHVNDSGFWLVSQYLGLSETQTFLSWSMMTLLLSLTGFVCGLLIYAVA